MYAFAWSSNTSAMVFRMANDENAEKPKPIDISELPQFTFSSDGFATDVRTYTLYVGVLILFTALFFLGAFTSFQRYDVR